MANADTYRVQLTTGLYSRIARKLGLGENGRSHVRRVASGERRSKRVERALHLEFKRIERLVASHRRKHELKEAA